MPDLHPVSFPPTPPVVGPLTVGKLLRLSSDRPETYRLPSKGGDPFFGFTRSWYYSAERDGLLRLIRVRTRGRLRGVTLVPYDDVAAIVAAAKLA